MQFSCDFRMDTWYLILLLFVAFGSAKRYTAPKTNPAYWKKHTQDEIQAALKIKPNNNVAKNVILFLGDGMSVTTVTTGRIYKGQLEGRSGEEEVLSFEKFPNIALSKTYLANRQVADSAASATAYMCGVKANYGTVGLDETVSRGDCESQHGAKVTSILKWTLDEGKSAGFVTTARVTHATLGAAFGHSADRNWEGDKEIANFGFTGKCKDLAQQLVENLKLQVVLGGGRRYFMLDNQTDPQTGEINSNHRADGRDLIKEWQTSRSEGGKKAEYVWSKSQFDAVDPAKTDYLLGLLASSHMQYDIDRNVTEEPSIAEMTKKSIEILRKNKKGYFLLVEGARIDHGHHNNSAKRALHDVVAFDKAVQTALETTDEEDTLIIVTADHSHVFSFGGYPQRGNGILDKVDEASMGSWDTPYDKMPKTTLIYGNGPGNPRENLTNIDTTDVNYQFSVAVHLEDETHGGEDVPIYARGPMAHLFYGTHEQTYIAGVMAYASCVGENKEHCKNRNTSGAEQTVKHSSFIVLVLLTYLLK